MSTLDLCILTFNCGRTLIDVSSFALLVLDPLFDSSAPDIVVLSLQEIAPIAYSFIGGTWLDPYLNSFVDALHITAQSHGGNTYENIVSKNVGMTALLVFVKADVVDKIKEVDVGGVGVGWLEMGNKGAVGTRLRWAGSEEDQDSYTTFVAAHLAPMEEKFERRNQDWENIIRNLVLTSERSVATSNSRPSTSVVAEEQQPLLSSATSASSSQHRIYDSSSYFFLAGDLNYRTRDTPPPPDAYKYYPRPTSDRSSPSHYSQYLTTDQLTRERLAGHTLQHLSEVPIDFPPTYKYEQPSHSEYSNELSTARTQDSANGSTVPDSLLAARNAKHSPDPYATETWIWAKHRAPSWCDRILFFASPALKIGKYKAMPLLASSDHRAVVLSAKIEASSLNAGTEGKQSPFAINPNWKSQRDTARRRELIVGVIAYAATTIEGTMIVIAVGIGLFAGALALKKYFAGV
ncbi:MAG: hypothetical protein M1820_008981 [Bogoriella megaspora]|nr:MAG: hypothetical protein M1820_008981 [Bogoriella megaspora]